MQSSLPREQKAQGSGCGFHLAARCRTRLAHFLILLWPWGGFCFISRFEKNWSTALSKRSGFVVKMKRGGGGTQLKLGSSTLQIRARTLFPCYTSALLYNLVSGTFGRVALNSSLNTWQILHLTFEEKKKSVICHPRPILKYNQANILSFGSFVVFLHYAQYHLTTQTHTGWCSGI